MKCAVFVSDKLGCVPIVECGGILLSPGDELVVALEHAKQIKNHYGAKIHHVHDVEVTGLTGGHYTVRRSVRSTKPDFMVDPKHDNGPDGVAPVEGAQDKSMSGKRVTKRK